ncbi:MAG: hypothetical protein IPK69_02085 [Phycisphaerales bacterium]|nr:MAG: hypothetical protein IPK69_02085 [Phycisphaerales bacterium]
MLRVMAYVRSERARGMAYVLAMLFIPASAIWASRGLSKFWSPASALASSEPEQPQLPLVSVEMLAPAQIDAEAARAAEGSRGRGFGPSPFGRD